MAVCEGAAEGVWEVAAGGVLRFGDVWGLASHIYLYAIRKLQVILQQPKETSSIDDRQ